MHFYLTSDIQRHVQVKVLSLRRIDQATEPLLLDSTKTPLPDESVTFQIHAKIVEDATTLGLPTMSSPVDGPWSHGCYWGETVKFLPKFRDLQGSAAIELTVQATGRFSGPMELGKCVVPVFSQYGKLKMGHRRLLLEPPPPPDGSAAPPLPPLPMLAEQQRLLRLLRAYERGDMDPVPWLDVLVRPRLQETLDANPGSQLADVKAAAPGSQKPPATTGATQGPGAPSCKSGTPVLDPLLTPFGLWTIDIELPTFPDDVLLHPTPLPNPYGAPPVTVGAKGGLGRAPLDPSASVVLVENADLPRTAGAGASGDPSTSGSGTPSHSASTRFALSSGLPWPVFLDPEAGLENPAEQKAQKLARPALYRGLAARDLKPGAEEKRRLEALLARPPASPLSVEERSLLWVFRYSLLAEPRALTKVLKSADWNDVSEAREAVRLMDQWGDVDRAVALELLSSDFPQPEIRAFAVSRLSSVDDRELCLVLQQLVQALRYEPHRAYPAPPDAQREGSNHSLLSSAMAPASLPSSKDERDHLSQHSSALSAGGSSVHNARSRAPGGLSTSASAQAGAPALHLEELLLCRACGSIEVATLLHWSLRALWDDPWHGGLFTAVHGRLFERLASQAPAYLTELRGQDEAVTILGKVATELKQMRGFTGQADRRGEKLKQLLAEGGDYGELGTLRCSLPLDPSMSIAGVVADECSVFRSAMAPLRVTFKVKPCPLTPGPPGSIPRKYVAIYKQGDDMRQDQLCIQMIRLMDHVLKRENLDLRLTPYRVLATSSRDGLLEFVEAQPLSRVLANHRTINAYLSARFPDSRGHDGVRPEVHENFLRSSAGYCVITYVLGVGDRHLDNLMMTPDGRLFHIDFGYMLGRDPKPYAAVPMRVAPEMVEAMGGPQHALFRSFKQYACEAYNILRKRSHLFYSLFHLMAGASLPDVGPSPAQVALKLQDKFRPDLDDEQACAHMISLIETSYTSLMVQLSEAQHKIAQMLR